MPTPPNPGPPIDMKALLFSLLLLTTSCAAVGEGLKEMGKGLAVAGVSVGATAVAGPVAGAGVGTATYLAMEAGEGVVLQDELNDAAVENVRTEYLAPTFLMMLSSYWKWLSIAAVLLAIINPRWFMALLKLPLKALRSLVGD